MKRHERVTFKAYQQDQMMLMPPSLEELVPEKHLVRVVSEVVDGLKLDLLLEQYKGGGSSSYHPRMMLKVLVYAYTQNVYTSRRIAKALRENVHFMWLSGQQRPDFRTVNRFRGEILRKAMEPVFASVLDLLLKRGYVRFEDYFTDGTKMEANAGRHTYVWKKAVKRYKARVQEKAREVLRQVEEENAAEDALYGDRDLPEMEGEEVSAEELEQKAQEIEEQLRRYGGSKRAEKAAKALRKDLIPRLRKYEQQEEMLGDRNSCSKTDPAATFMRMNDTTVSGAPLKAGYNVQIGTENQFVLGYSVHQRPGDTGCLIPHLEQSYRRSGRRPKNLIGDAGFGSEENYAYLVAHGIGNYLQYNTFGREQRPRHKPDPFNFENWPYDAESDTYQCPAGQLLSFKYTNKRTSQNGYQSQRRVYEAQNCLGCSLRSQCTRRKETNRRITFSAHGKALRDQARQNLTSPKGQELRSRRRTEPETVFGCIKGNRSFRRFLLRGLEKVTTEWGLLSVAHNVARMATLAV